MTPASPPDEIAAAALPPVWQRALGRVVAYLRAGGLGPEPAVQLANEAVTRARAAGDPETAQDAVLTALRIGSEMLRESRPATPREQPLVPSSDRGKMRRQSLASVIELVPRRRRPGAARRSLPAAKTAAPGQARPSRRSRHAQRRRMAFTALILGTTVWGAATFTKILAVDGLSPLDIAHIAVFSVLLLWLSQSFWTLGAGFAVRAWRLMDGGSREGAGFDPDGPRVALIMPVYNEAPQRVAAGLRAMWEDLVAASRGAARFDLFILSDTTDPDCWLAEIAAWQALRRVVPAGSHIFYRRRVQNTARKAGNIEDFLTRWGPRYAYMVVLDADSLMTAASILELTRRMDLNPGVGLIQAPPKLVRGTSLFARMLQFAGEAYGPLSATGISYWALGEGNYWGHNAIIRVAPFMELCGLPQLPGRAPFGGHILSHDFVEAALMRRGGYQVWIADDLGGSYEESPPTLSDFAVRDRRWCQGNLQHIKIVFARHLHWVSRLHLAIGIMSYITSPLWLLFLILSAAQAWELTYGRPVYFIQGWPFPLLPISVATQAALLLTIMLGLLFVPKLMGLLLGLADPPRRRRLGGGLRLTLSALLETLLSAMVAPVMMLFHTGFVTSILLGGAIDWKPQRRDAAAGALATTVHNFLLPTVAGLAAGLVTWRFTPSLLVWLLPVLAGLVLAIPLALVTDSARAGLALRRHGFLLIEEESERPQVMQRLDALLAEPGTPMILPSFERTVLDWRANRLHCGLLQAIGASGQATSEELQLLERKALYLGPASLAMAERRALLESPEALERLHLAAWVLWPELGIDVERPAGDRARQPDPAKAGTTAVEAAA